MVDAAAGGAAGAAGGAAGAADAEDDASPPPADRNADAWENVNQNSDFSVFDL